VGFRAVGWDEAQRNPSNGYDLETAIAASEWEGAVMTPGMQALLGRYALGEITDTEFRAPTSIGIGTRTITRTYIQIRMAEQYG